MPAKLTYKEAGRDMLEVQEYDTVGEAMGYAITFVAMAQHVVGISVSVFHGDGTECASWTSDGRKWIVLVNGRISEHIS